MRFIARLLVTAVAVWIAVQVVPGLDYDGTVLNLLVIAFVFGVINAVLRPIVLFLSCPLLVVTLGLFALVVNAIMFWLVIWVSGEFSLGLSSEGHLATFLGALVVSIVSGVLNLLVPDK